MEQMMNDLKEGVFQKMDELYESLRDQFRNDLREIREESADTSRRIDDILRRLDSPQRSTEFRQDGTHSRSLETVPQSVCGTAEDSPQDNPAGAGQTDCLFQWPTSITEDVADSGIASGLTVEPHAGAFSRRSVHGTRTDFPRHSLYTVEETSAVSSSMESQFDWGRNTQTLSDMTSRFPTTKVTFQFCGETYDAATGNRIWTDAERGRDAYRDFLNPAGSIPFDHIPSDQPMATAIQLLDQETRSAFLGNPTRQTVPSNPISTSTRPVPSTRSVWSHPLQGTIPSVMSGVSRQESRPCYAPSGPQITPKVVNNQESTQDSFGKGVFRLKVDHYDGTQPLEDYLLQFDVVAVALSWDRQQRTTMLTASLRGQALAVFSNLRPEHRHDWTRLVNALRLRFGREHLRELAHVELKARRQRNKEDLAAFAEDVRRLVRRAFPECPSAAQNRIAIQQFVDGINDLDVQDWVRMSRPATLDGAVVGAMECETSRKATRSNRPHIRAVEVETPCEDRNPSSLSDAAERFGEILSGGAEDG